MYQFFTFLFDMYQFFTFSYHIHQFIDVFILHAHIFYVFCKYWPDDGLLRPQLVASNTITKQTHSCVRRSAHLISFY